MGHEMYGVKSRFRRLSLPEYPKTLQGIVEEYRDEKVTDELPDFIVNTYESLQTIGAKIFEQNTSQDSKGKLEELTF